MKAILERIANALGRVRGHYLHRISWNGWAALRENQ